jgi:hypothetical protein
MSKNTLPKNETPEPGIKRNNFFFRTAAGFLTAPFRKNDPSAGLSSRHWIWDFTLFFVFLSQYLVWSWFEKAGTVLLAAVLGGYLLALFRNGKAAFQNYDLFNGWFLIAPVFLLGTNAKWVLPYGVSFSPAHAIMMGTAGFFILWNALRSLPRDPVPSDLGSFQARLLLFLLIVLGVLLRMHNANEPVGLYWYDQSEEARDPRYIVDLSIHRFIFDYGSRGPLFVYLIAGIWKLFPEASSLLAIRAAVIVVDALIIWVFYLLGKEFNGKRSTGLFFAALGAVSRQMIIKGFLGTYVNCFILFVALDMLLLFRLFKKPDLKHFLTWITAVSLGNYVYLVYRPWTIAMILIVAVWVFLKKEERSAGLAAWVLLLGIGGFWIYYFLDNSDFLRQWLGHRPNLPSSLVYAFMVLLAWNFLEVYWASRKEGKGLKLLYWAISCGLAYWLVKPFFESPALYERFQTATVFMEETHLSLQWLAIKFSEFSWVFRFLFFGDRDEGSIGPSGDSFFDFYAILVIFLGFFSIAARPSWKKLFLFLPAFIGVFPALAGPNAHSARILGCLAPLYLIGAVGLNHLWEVCRSGRDGKKFVRFLFVPLFVLGLAQAAKSNIFRVDKWYNSWNGDTLLYDQVKKDEKNFRTYVCFATPDFMPPQPVMDVLFEKSTVYIWQPSNPVFLTRGEKGKDVVLVFYKADKNLEKKLRNDFPDAVWADVIYRNEIPFMYRVLIPFDQITEDPGRVLYIVRKEPPYWQRRLYDGYYGFARGMILSEDRVSNPRDPFLSGESGLFGCVPSCSIRGVLEAGVSGTYWFNCETTKPVYLSIDGKKTLDIRTEGKIKARSYQLKLSAGNHSIEMKTYFKSGQDIPPVYVTPPSGAKFEFLLSPLP